MGRSNRRADQHEPLAVGRLAGMERRESHPDGDWIVREVRGRGEGRTFRCPGCQQQVSDHQPHIVAWPAGGLVGIDARRHWHTPCWRHRSRRH